MSRFNRVAELEIRIRNQNFSNFVETIKIKELRISFQIYKSLSYSANTCRLDLYNLSKQNRAKIKTFGGEISIFAGYTQDSGSQLLFVGDTTTVSHIFSQPEIISTFYCGDGERVLNNIITDFSYASNVSARTVLRNIASKVGLEIAFFAETPDLFWENGFQFTGMVKDAIKKATDYLNLVPTIQNKKLYILNKTIPRSGQNFVISQFNGMISVPERYTFSRFNPWTGAPKAGYKVSTLLRPEIIPGDKVRVISKKIDLDDVFYVDSINHVGDTYGTTWQSEFELIGL